MSVEKLEEMLTEILVNQETILANQEVADEKLNDIVEQLNNLNLDTDGFQVRAED